ncbi:translocation/assembly module TamB, partial [bacterium]|nr:translocation/assembly module TamB [bacterium]
IRESMTLSFYDYLASGVAYVTGSLQEQIEQRFEYWMGFDEFSIDPIMSTSNESPSAKFTVKKRFGPDLSVLYSRSASSSGDLLLIEYKISDNLFILGQKTEDNSIGANIRYRWEFE